MNIQIKKTINTHRIRWLLSIVSVLCLLGFASYVLANKSLVEKCLGGFCFSGSLMKESELVSKYGEGHKIEIDGVARKHQYYDPKQKLWVEFESHYHGDYEIESILVTRKKLCSKKYVPKVPFNPLMTSHGIGIDASPREVVKVYGKPSLRGITAKGYYDYLIGEGFSFLFYDKGEEDLLWTAFLFKKNKLHTISISNSE